MPRIIQFQAENTKRLKAVDIELSPGLNVLGGKNKQGKTSVLDIIMNLIRGEKYTPSNPVHDGAKKGIAEITLDDGTTIKASYTKNGRAGLRISGADTEGGPQAFLNKLFGANSLDVREFLATTGKARNEILLSCVGVDLTPWQEKHKELYAKRAEVTKDEKRAKGHYEKLPYNEEAGDEIITAKKLIEEQQEILRKNGENATKRHFVKLIRSDLEETNKDLLRKAKSIEDLEAKLKQAKEEYAELQKKQSSFATDLEQAEKTAAQLQDESTEAIEAKLQEIDETNVRVRQNQERAKAEAEYKAFAEERKSLTNQIETNQQEMMETLAGVEWPLEGLTVGLDGSLAYNDNEWDCMSTAEQMMVASAIQAKINPDAKIVLVDRLEVMDTDSMAEYAKWCDDNQVQVIATRVTTRTDEADWIIEDGMVAAEGERPKAEKKPGLSLSL
jgi:hypothetical protein